VPLLKQAARTTGLEDTALSTRDQVFFDPGFLPSAGRTAEALYLTLADFDFTNPFYEEEFIPAYRDRFGGLEGDPPFIGLYHDFAWDATNMTLDSIEAVAIDRGGTLLIPRTALRDALFATAGYPGLVGTLSCLPTGDCNPDAAMDLWQVQNRRFVLLTP
jgi:branched-chain amino acid transport system substrate-binding protein